MARGGRTGGRQSGKSQTIAVVEAVIEEAKEAGFRVELIDGVVPMIPESDIASFERKKAVLDWLKTARTVGGGRIFKEGIVLEPRRPKPPSELGFPYNEPEVMARYAREEKAQ